LGDRPAAGRLGTVRPPGARGPPGRPGTALVSGGKPRPA